MFPLNTPVTIDDNLLSGEGLVKGIYLNGYIIEITKNTSNQKLNYTHYLIHNQFVKELKSYKTGDFVSFKSGDISGKGEILNTSKDGQGRIIYYLKCKTSFTDNYILDVPPSDILEVLSETPI